MKDASEPTNIVNLSSRFESRPGRGGELLENLRTIATRRLREALAALFNNVDDALFDLAEKADSNAAQTHYFDGMRDVRKRRPAIERAFLAQLQQALDEHAGGRRPANGGDGAITSPQFGLELSLVADHELEESLAITGMVGKNESRLARELFALNQRMALICGGIRVDDASNPLGPAALAQAFHQAMRELVADMRVKLIVYKLFDRYVLSTLDELYQEVNASLISAGVLPQLRPELQRQPGQPPATADTTAAPLPDTGADGRAAPAEELDGQASNELLHTLAQLLRARRADTTDRLDDGRAGHVAPLPSANELIGALSVLQSRASAAYESVALEREVQQLKQELLNQLGSLRGERPQHVAHVDEDTIDLVGMLFEFIVEDRNLPAPMQVLLARLQIPYLKAALLDRRLFSQRQHPARRLLDGLAEAAQGWSEEADHDGRLQAMVKRIVERLLQEFDDDLHLFEQLGEELQQFQQAQRRRAELAEQRVAESTSGREKLEQARRRAAREVLQRIGDRTLPPLLHGVLTRAWANYLVLTLLRQGEQSQEYRDALRFVGDFVDSAQPMRDAEARQALRQLLPNIERALRRGLGIVAFQEHDIERLLDQLQLFYRRQLGESVADIAASAELEVAAATLPPNLTSVTEAVAAASSDAVDELRGEPSPAQVLANTLSPGSWLELRVDGADGERAKLSWISPISGRYLFVNRRGLKVADYSPYELAERLADGRAALLESSPLFERALGAIVERLRQSEPNLSA